MIANAFWTITSTVLSFGLSFVHPTFHAPHPRPSPTPMAIATPAPTVDQLIPSASPTPKGT